MATVYYFDGTFDGMLTAVFDAFARKERQVELLRDGEPVSLFSEGTHRVATDEAKAARVWRKLTAVVSEGAASALVTAFLTDNAEFAGRAFEFVCRAVTSGTPMENDFSDMAVLAVLKECRRVRGEAHRMKQFVRFQKAADGTYFAMVEPLFDVLPMAIDHFRDRFRDQPFIIYDRARDYGYYYDGHSQLRRMRMSSHSGHMVTGKLSDKLMDAEERLYQRLWRAYFKSTAIAERTNPRKQRQDMPVRYWKYLTEMNGDD